MRGQLILFEGLIGFGQGNNVEREISNNTCRGIFTRGQGSKHFKSCDAFIVFTEIRFYLAISKKNNNDFDRLHIYQWRV